MSDVESLHVERHVVWRSSLDRSPRPDRTGDEPMSSGSLPYDSVGLTVLSWIDVHIPQNSVGLTVLYISQYGL